MKITCWFVLFLLLFPLLGNSQESGQGYVSAYLDYRNYFYAFENGAPHQLESQPVKSFLAQGKIIAYVNSANNLIAYANDEKTNLGDYTNTNYNLTNNFLVYKRDQLLAVFDKGEVTRLSFFIRDYKISDELVAFRDQNIDILKAWYNGKTYEIENTLVGDLGEYKAGKNLVAYVNYQRYFKVWHNDQIFELDNTPPSQFEAGKNIVGYIEGIQQTLNCYYNSKVIVLDQLNPMSFKVGDDLIAFVSDEGYFKIFSDGKLVKVESYPPEFYSVKDRTVLFYASNKLQLFLNGTRYELDEFVPDNFKISFDNVAWQDNAKRLYLFNDGKVHLVTTEIFTEYDLNGDVLTYKLPDGTYRIYYNGKTY